MQQVRVHGPGDVRLDEIPDPEPGPDDVVVDVAACGVCGSDLKYIATGGLMGPGPEPMPLGHELAGVVAHVGRDVEGVATGDRVVVNPGNNDLSHIGNGGTEGAFTRRLLVRGAGRGGRLFTVPDELPLDVAALTEPVGVAMNAVDKAEVRAGDRVAVIGAGPIGLGAVVTCIDRGAADVVAVDLSPERLELASTLGAHAVVRADADDLWAVLRERHGTVDTVFGPMAATEAYVECSGAAPVIPDLIAHAGTEARIAIAGLHVDDIATSFLQVLTKELTIRGAMEYPERFEDALDLVARRDVSAMITHRVPLDRWDEVMALIAGPPSFAKIMVTMG